MAKDWKSLLLYQLGRNGEPSTKLRRAAANATTILTHDPAWAGVLAFDEFRGSVVARRSPPWVDVDAPASVEPGEWTDTDTARLANWLARRYALDLATTLLEQAIGVAADRAHVHPVRDWLRGLRWDGTARLDGLFVEYFGAPDTPYSRGVGARFAIGAVARVMRPGCKVDCVPVLEGAQGIGKSTAVRILAGDAWFFDTPIVMGDKDGYQALRGKWIGELGELHSLGRSDLNRAKNFLSATSDTYRASFGRRTHDYPRQIVFVGTTNAVEYLRDETGNRRFWPVRCSRVDLEALRRDRAQLWAEARVRFERGEAWHVDTAELAALCAAEQEERFEADAWEGPIGDYVTHAGHPERRTAGVTLGDVLETAIGVKADRWDKPAQMRATAVLRRLGWERSNPRRGGGKRERVWLPKAARVVPVPGVVPEVVPPASPQKHHGSSHVTPQAPAHERAHRGDDDQKSDLYGTSGAGGAGGVRDDDDWWNSRATDAGAWP